MIKFNFLHPIFCCKLTSSFVLIQRVVHSCEVLVLYVLQVFDIVSYLEEACQLLEMEVVELFLILCQWFVHPWHCVLVLRLEEA